MLDKNTLIKVTNRDNGEVGYTIPDLNLTRNFLSGETKELTMEELRKLAFSAPAGMAILNKYLLIENEEAVKELLNQVEPEYFYTEEDVKNLLLNGSLDAFKDCLDFAPKGIIELIKKYAVELNLNDLAKRQAILEKTGFSVDSAIRVNEETSDEAVVETRTRRVSTPTKTTTTVRRTQPTTNYKVTSIKK